MVGLGLGLTRQHAVARWWPDEAGFALDFTMGEAVVANERFAAAGLLICDRAGPALAPTTSGDVVAFASDAPRITDRGLLIEDGRTNLLLNSFSPAPQSVALAAGSYALSMAGGGQVDLDGTVSGSATAAAPIVFTLAEPQTVTVVPAGDVSFFQLEAGVFPTSPIATGAAPASRAAEATRLAEPTLFDPGACTVLIEWEQVAPGAAAESGVQTLMRWISPGGVWSRMRSGSVVIAQMQDAGGNLVFNAGADVTAVPGIHRVALALAPDDMAFAWNASLDGTGGIAVDSAGTPAPDPVSVYLGGAVASERLNGWIRKLIYWPERLTDGHLLSLAQGSA